MKKYLLLATFLTALLFLLGCRLGTNLGETARNLVGDLLTTPTPENQTRYAQITSIPVQESQPDEQSPVLFFDDFSDLNSGWTEESDEAGGRGYSDGGYHIFVTKSEWCYWTSIDVTYGDVIIEVDGQKLSGSNVNEYGVICRLNSHDNYYYLGVGSDGYYGIGKNINDEWIDLGEEEQTYNSHMISGGNSINHLKATCDFDQLTLEVNGTVLMDVVDPELRSGDVGMYACAFEEAGVDILFDNFRVSRP